MATRRPSKSALSKWFQEWLSVKSTATTLSERQADLRERILGAVVESGEEDDNGNLWYELPEPVEFTDPKGRTFQYRSLKRERHLIPANPLPDPDLAEQLLVEKGLWLDEKQEKSLRSIQLSNQFVTIKVEVDVDAIAAAYFKNIITDDEYESILVEQRESFQFRPSET